MLERIKTFLECFFVWNVKPRGGIGEADVVGIFAFGFRKNAKPGLSNLAMAGFAEAIYRNFNLPTISQWEVDKAITQYSCHTVIRRHREENKYLDTLEVARQIVEEMKTQNWKKVLVIAHHLHVWRCVRILKKLGVEIIIPTRLDLIPFDPQSEQWWTRGPKRWIFKEIFIRLGSFAKGWI